jgi:hypothetical protein
MKKTISLITLLLGASFCHSQNVKFLEQISTISFWSIDDVMINGYGFKELTINKERTKKYAKVVNDDINSFISITILNTSNSSKHTMDITVGPNYSMDEFKNDLVENEYHYNGKSNYGFLMYKKESTYFLVSEKPNSEGANQIILTPKQE